MQDCHLSDILKKELTEYRKTYGTDPEALWIGGDEYDDILEDMRTDRRFIKAPTQMGGGVITYFGIDLHVNLRKNYKGLYTMDPEALETILDLLTEEQLAVLMTDPNETVRRLAEETYNKTYNKNASG